MASELKWLLENLRHNRLVWVLNIAWFEIRGQLRFFASNYKPDFWNVEFHKPTSNIFLNSRTDNLIENTIICRKKRKLKSSSFDKSKPFLGLYHGFFALL